MSILLFFKFFTSQGREEEFLQFVRHKYGIVDDDHNKMPSEENEQQGRTDGSNSRNSNGLGVVKTASDGADSGKKEGGGIEGGGGLSASTRGRADREVYSLCHPLRK